MLDDMLRTLCCTFAAVYTLLVINTGNVVDDGNGAMLTGLLAQMTANTTCTTGIDHRFTFILGYAANYILCIVRDQLDQALRTGSYTLATGLTGLLVNLCNTIYDMDCIKRTCLYTGTISETAVIT